MEHAHHFSFRATDKDRAELSQLGVTRIKEIYRGTRAHTIAFDVNESHPQWQRILKWTARRPNRHRAIDTQTTTFTRREILSADHAVVASTWHRGYPQPEQVDESGYLAVTYDLSAHYCWECRSVSRQIAPFRMKGEPRWGRRSILSLEWVCDELFVTPSLWEQTFRPRRIGCLPVLNARGTAPLRSVVQLVVQEIVHLQLPARAGQRCRACGARKYVTHARGLFPRLRTAPSGHLARSAQTFGSGGIAFNAFIASSELVRELTEQGFRGARFWPLAR